MTEKRKIVVVDDEGNGRDTTVKDLLGLTPQEEAEIERIIRRSDEDERD